VAFFDKLCKRHRAVEGHDAVWQIAKRRVCVRQPLLSVAAWLGLVGGWAGHEPTARTNRRRLPDA